MQTCVQCGSDVEGKFCINCGQKKDVHRLTFKFFISDFLDRIYGLDGAFPRTVIGMSKNPGTLVKEYIHGVRRKYVGPVGFYFLMFGIFLLLIEMSDYTIYDYFPKTETINESFNESAGIKSTERSKQMTIEVQQFLFDNIQYFVVLMLPFFGIWGRILFKKSGINILEGTVFGLYIVGNANLFSIVGFIIFAIFGVKNLVITGILSAAYYVWGLTQFYQGKFSIGGALKSLALYALAYISFMIFIMLVALPVGIVYALLEK